MTKYIVPMYLNKYTKILKVNSNSSERTVDTCSPEQELASP